MKEWRVAEPVDVTRSLGPAQNRDARALDHRCRHVHIISQSLNPTKPAKLSYMRLHNHRTPLMELLPLPGQL